MTDESACEVELYADNHVFLTLGQVREAYLNGEIDKHEAINAAGCLANGWGYFIETEPKKPDPIPKNSIDRLQLRMQLEKIPFLEAVRLIGFRKAIRYLFQRSR